MPFPCPSSLVVKLLQIQAPKALPSALKLNPSCDPRDPRSLLPLREAQLVD